jgi:acyl-coenzyme A synthetase/AMP-(fatty) acid ligase
VLDKNGYHTGDQGYKDTDGYFYVNGRKDNLIKVGGHRINTLEVEDVIIDTGCAIEVAVIGVADILQGNKLIAFIVPKNRGFNEEYLLKRCREILPAYKVPKEMKLISTIPKKNNGKIDYSKCHQLIL